MTVYSHLFWLLCASVVINQVHSRSIRRKDMKRCGVNDGPIARPKSRYVRSLGTVVDEHWNKKIITYEIVNKPQPYPNWVKYPQMGTERVEELVLQAFAEWAPHCGLRFQRWQDEDGHPDLRISFESGSHQDGSPFNGPGSELAHSDYPQENGVQIHFDDDEVWIDERPTRFEESLNVASFYPILLHEMGHALGLKHSYDPNSIMYAYENSHVQHLAASDILTMRRTYGISEDNANSLSSEENIELLTSTKPTVQEHLTGSSEDVSLTTPSDVSLDSSSEVSLTTPSEVSLDSSSNEVSLPTPSDTSPSSSSEEASLNNPSEKVSITTSFEDVSHSSSSEEVSHSTPSEVSQSSSSEEVSHSTSSEVSHSTSSEVSHSTSSEISQSSSSEEVPHSTPSEVSQSSSSEEVPHSTPSEVSQSSSSEEVSHSTPSEVSQSSSSEEVPHSTPSEVSQSSSSEEVSHSTPSEVSQSSSSEEVSHSTPSEVSQSSSSEEVSHSTPSEVSQSSSSEEVSHSTPLEEAPIITPSRVPYTTSTEVVPSTTSLDPAFIYNELYTNDQFDQIPISTSQVPPTSEVAYTTSEVAYTTSEVPYTTSEVAYTTSEDPTFIYNKLDTKDHVDHMPISTSQVPPTSEVASTTSKDPTFIYNEIDMKDHFHQIPISTSQVLPTSEVAYTTSDEPTIIQSVVAFSTTSETPITTMEIPTYSASKDLISSTSPEELPTTPSPEKATTVSTMDVPSSTESRELTTTQSVEVPPSLSDVQPTSDNAIDFYIFQDLMYIIRNNYPFYLDNPSLSIKEKYLQLKRENPEMLRNLIYLYRIYKMYRPDKISTTTEKQFASVVPSDSTLTPHQNLPAVTPTQSASYYLPYSYIR